MKSTAVKKPVVKQVKFEEQANLDENASFKDIRRIIQELIQEELGRLQITKKCKCKDVDENDDDYMDIDITRAEEIRDLATVEGIINAHSVSVVLDSASNKDLMPKFIADELGLITNTDSSYIIRGTAGEMKFSESVEATVSLAPNCDIKTTFVVSDIHAIPEIILGRSTLKRYNYDLFESKDHASITCNGKNFFIPIISDKNRHKCKKSLVVEALTQ